jgi:hypothetical protein
MNWLWRRRTQAGWLLLGVLLVFVLWRLKEDGDRVAAAQRRADAAFNAFEQETKIRTAQNCQQTVDRSDTLRKLLIDSANGQPDQARKDMILKYIAENYPPLKCDDNGKAIVIAVPEETTTTEG